jgi:hypothetical protein
MIQTAEQLIENFRTLPEPEREKFFELIEAEKGEKTVNGNDLEQRNEKFRRALKWIDQHRVEFDGQFVLLEGDELIAHGMDAKALYAEARGRGIKTPFVERVRAKVLPFGGW